MSTDIDYQEMHTDTEHISFVKETLGYTHIYCIQCERYISVGEIITLLENKIEELESILNKIKKIINFGVI